MAYRTSLTLLPKRSLRILFASRGIPIRTFTSNPTPPRQPTSHPLSKPFRPLSSTKAAAPWAAALTAGLLLGAATLSATFLPSSSSASSSERPTETTMSAKLIPPNPSEVMVIRDVTPNIVTLSVPFTRVGLFKIGGRATVVRLSSGSLAVFSPVALTPEVKAKLSEMGGPLRYIVAPDMEHHIFVSEWAQAFPDARLVGPAGLPEKRAKADDPKIGKEPFATVFAAGPAKADTRVGDEFDRDFAYEYVDAHPNRELVFFYRPDRVLIQADLMFNLPATEQYSRVPGGPQQDGLLGRLFAGLQTPGAAGDAKAMRRLTWYLISARDRPGFDASIRRIHAWDFDTMIPCHGDTLVGDGKRVFERVFEWHLGQGKL